MSEMRLGNIEAVFADIIWEKEPLPTRDLVELCRDKLNWAKSTTYTVLKRLCDKGLFVNENGIVSSLLTKDEYRSRQSRQLVEEVFEGSLPAFLAAFSAGKKLSPEEAEEIRRMIDEA